MNVPEPAPLAEDGGIGISAAGADRRWRAAVVLLALAAIGLVLLSTSKYGAGISPDSAAYLDVARNLVAGRGFVFHTGEPLAWWPPLYPMLLAFIGFATGLDPATFAHLVNAMLFALVISLSARLFRTSLRHSATYSVLGVCAIVLSTPLSQVYAMAWSECLFIPLVLLYLVSAQRYWERGRVLSLAVMVLSTALACLTRYVGLALAPAGALTIVLASGANIKTRFARAILFVVLSLAPLGLWLLRNHHLTGTFAGSRGLSTFPIVDNVILCVETMLSWYTFVVPSRFVALALIAVLTIVVLSSRAVTRRLTSSLEIVFIGHSPAVLFLATYTIVLSMAGTRDAFVESRTLSPIYVPVTLILMKLAHDLISASRSLAKVAVNKVPVILVALWLCLSLVSVARTTVGRFKNGAGGLNSRKWRGSETVAYARQMPYTNGDRPVYSNGTDALWELARVNASELPRRAVVDQSNLQGHWPAKSPSVLVWFDNRRWRVHLFSVEELREIADVEELAHLSDGSIYRVAVRHTAPPR